MFCTQIISYIFNFEDNKLKCCFALYVYYIKSLSWTHCLNLRIFNFCLYVDIFCQFLLSIDFFVLSIVMSILFIFKQFKLQKKQYLSLVLEYCVE